jgi:hypothetical protein
MKRSKRIMSKIMLGRLARGIVLCGLAAATAGSLTNTLPAQADPHSGPQTEQTVTVSFSGGTLADFVAAVRGAGNGLNILAPSEASKVGPLPAITLVNAPVSSALEAVTTIVDRSRFDVVVHTMRNGPPNQTVYSVRVSVAPSAEPRPLEPRQVKVFSLRGLTDSPGKKAEGTMLPTQTVLTAIDTGLALATEEGDTPVLKYHTDSGLLFVRGTAAQLAVVAQTLEQLHNDLLHLQAAAAAAAAAKDSVKPGAEGERVGR